MLAQQYGVDSATTDYKSLLLNDDLEAIIVCTPPWLTPQITIESLEAGKHVLCEKPMAVHVDMAQKVREAEARSGRKVQVGFTYRHGPLFETLKGWIQAGELGSPLVYRLGIFDEVWNPEGDPEHYRRIFETMKRGSPSIHDGAHVADYLNFFVDSPVQDVFSYGLKTRPEFPSSNYDLTVIRFANGDLAKVEIGWFLPNFPQGEFEVMGPRGIAVFNREEKTVRIKSGQTTREVRLEEDYFESCFRIQLEKFIQSIRTGTPCLPGVDEGIASLALTTTIVEKIKEDEARRRERNEYFQG